MPCNLLPHAYEQLVNEDIQWLESATPDTLERDHIIAVLRHSVAEYRLRGYDEAMNRTGPHHSRPAVPPPEQTHGKEGA